jgi:hypothetical protein
VDASTIHCRDVRRERRLVCGVETLRPVRLVTTMNFFRGYIAALMIAGPIWIVALIVLLGRGQ